MAPARQGFAHTRQGIHFEPAILLCRDSQYATQARHMFVHSPYACSGHSGAFSRREARGGQLVDIHTMQKTSSADHPAPHNLFELSVVSIGTTSP